MAQHDYSIANQSGAAFRSDLNNALSAIVSQNSGASEPSTTYAYMTWADTTNGVMKMRNGANSAWITLYQLDGEWTSIAFENGTAAAPSIYFKDSGTDTGFFSPGTDSVGITTGGTERLRFASTGALGLSGANYGNSGQLLTSNGSASAPTWQDLSLSGIGDGTAAAPSIAFSADTNTGIYRPGADTFGISTGGSERARIDSSGRLGIGTATAASSRKLTVKNDGSNGGIAITNTNDDVVGQFCGENVGTSQELGIYSLSNMRLYTGGTQRATIDTSGRWLLGTSSASAAATSVLVQGNGSSSTAEGIIRLTRGTTTPGASDELGTIAFGDSNHNTAAYLACNRDGGTWNTSTSRPTRLAFSTTADGASSPSERFRIDSSGYMQGNVNGLGAGRIPAMQYYRLNSNLAGSNVNTAQSVFGVGVTLVGSTVYEFEALYTLSKTAGTTSHTVGLGFGGTATINNILHTGFTVDISGSVPILDASPESYTSNTAANQATTSAIAVATYTYSCILRGTVSINAGGTFIPQYTLSAAPGGAYSTVAGSYFRIWPLGASGANTSIGTWA